MQLLHIDSSVLGPNSASRALSAEIVAKQVALHPGIQVIHRDLAADAALHLSPAHLAAWQGAGASDGAASDGAASGCTASDGAASGGTVSGGAASGGTLSGGAVPHSLFSADLAKGSAYLEELQAANIIVIGAPMYNFSIPSQLKAWIDRVVIAGKTFRYGPNGAEGLLSKSTKVYIASSRGNVYAAGSPVAALEHHESYLTGVLSFIGLTDVTIVRAEGLAFGPEAKEAAMSQARANIAAMAA